MSFLPHARFEEAGTDGRRDLAAREIAIAARIGEMLFAAYPGHIWAVHVDLHTKYKAATIKLPVLMPARAHYVIPASYLGTLPDMRRAVMRAGGEILERYRIPRSGLRIDQASFLDARAAALRPGVKEVPV